jgi:stage II sporulation protein M
MGPVPRSTRGLSPQAILARYVGLMRASWPWLSITVALFVVSMIGGVVAALVSPDSQAELLRRAAEALQPAVQALRQGDNSRAIGLIFWNNLRSTLLILGTGALVWPLLFGVPLLAVGLNGYLLGVVMVLSEQGLERVLTAILPHGIFELPALWIAGAWSLKMGLAWLLPTASGRRGAVWAASVVEGLWIVPLITVLLAIAAVVEVLITLPLNRPPGL